MDKLPLQLLMQRIEQLHHDQSTRFDRIEIKFDKHVDMTESRIDRIEGRLATWSGAIGIIAGLIGSGLTLVVTSVKAHWG